MSLDPTQSSRQTGDEPHIDLARVELLGAVDAVVLLRREAVQSLLARCVASNEALPSVVRRFLFRIATPETPSDTLVHSVQDRIWRRLDEIESLEWDSGDATLKIRYLDGSEENDNLEQFPDQFLKNFEDEISHFTSRGVRLITYAAHYITQCRRCGVVAEISECDEGVVLHLFSEKKFLLQEPLSLLEFIDSRRDLLTPLTEAGRRLVIGFLSTNDDLVSRLREITEIKEDPKDGFMVLEVRDDPGVWLFHDQNPERFLSQFSDTIESLPPTIRAGLIETVRGSIGPWNYRGMAKSLVLNSDLSLTIDLAQGGTQPIYLPMPGEDFLDRFVRGSSLGPESRDLLTRVFLSNVVPNWCRYGYIVKVQEHPSGAVLCTSCDGESFPVCDFYTDSGDFIADHVDSNPFLSHQAKRFLREAAKRIDHPAFYLRGFTYQIFDDPIRREVSLYTFRPGNPVAIFSYRDTE